MNSNYGLRCAAAMVCFMFYGNAFAQLHGGTVRPLPGEAIVAKGRPMLPQAKIPLQTNKQAGPPDPSKPLAVYSHGDPTNEEQYILELINRARANPAGEGQRLFSTTDPDITESYNYWGTPTRAQVKSDFSQYPVQPPLAFNAKLLEAARAHSADMLAHNFQGHDSYDGTAFNVRVASHGYKGGYIGENVFAYGKSTWDVHASFQIDFGNPGLGHRENIMNFTIDPYREIGIGLLNGGAGLPDVGPMIATEDFGKTGQTFVLGVVYDDLNKNGFYDVGEGLGGVSIKLSSGQNSAVTSTSGGYAIPFTGTTSVTVTASGGALAVSVAHTVDFDGENVKVDFNPDKSGLPALVTLINHIADTVNFDTTKLIWNKVVGAQKYRVQFSNSPTFSSLILNDSSLTDSSRMITSLRNDSVYYWRVQAKNAKGWGQFSSTGTFKVLLLPSMPTLLSPAQGAFLPFTDAVLVWRQTTNAAGAYWVELSTDPMMSSLTLEDKSVLDTTLTIPANKLTDGKKYYWRVHALNEVGYGLASAISSFTVTSASVASNPGVLSSIRVYPNPSNSQTRISFALERTEPVSLIFYAPGGEELQRIDLGMCTATTHDYLWENRKLPSGTYLFELRTGSSVQTGSIVVIH